MTDNRDVTVSSVIPRNDKWKNEVTEVNDCLISMCRDENIPFIIHTNIQKRKKKKEKENQRKISTIVIVSCTLLNIKDSIKIRDNFVKYLRGLSS